MWHCFVSLEWTHLHSDGRRFLFFLLLTPWLPPSSSRGRLKRVKILES